MFIDLKKKWELGLVLEAVASSMLENTGIILIGNTIPVRISTLLLRAGV